MADVLHSYSPLTGIGEGGRRIMRNWGIYSVVTGKGMNYLVIFRDEYSRDEGCGCRD